MKASNLQWKAQLGDRVPDHLTAEIDVFEHEIALRKQGKIEDRAREQLGRSDAAVVMLRRMWRRQLDALAGGGQATEFGSPDPQAIRQEELDAMGFNA